MEAGNIQTVRILTVFCICLVTCLILTTSVLLRRIRKKETRANLDPVTGAMSHSGFTAAAEKALRSPGSQCTMVAMCLQNYTQILETFGPDDCDQVLRHLYAVLKANLSNAEPVARIHCGTFCFLMRNCQEEALRTRLSRILDSANRFNQQRKLPYVLNLTFGICIPESREETAVHLLENAIALAAPSEDAPFCFRKPGTAGSACRKWELVQQLDSSVKSGDFIVYLQPKIRLSDSRIVGAEALIRWRHPQKGMLTPEMFLSSLEEYHVIRQLDLYVFEKVCRSLSKWIAAGWKPCPISVNLSAQTLLSASILDDLATLCQKYRIQPEHIELELGESFLSCSTQVISDLSKDIHRHGFRCALDNFGRSSMPVHILRETEVDAIKLDRSFFSTENNSRSNRFLVDGILKFATQMQISTIAEGIDNASQVQYLQQAGCDQAQGFYYLRPMTLEEFQNTVYHKGDLRYLTESGGRSAAQQTSSNKIVMFSLRLEEDQLILSDAFSPLLEGQTRICNVLDLFRYSDLIHENDRKDFFHLLERCCREDGWVDNTLRFFTARGRYEWLEVHMHREYAAFDKVTVISGTLVNIAGWDNEVNRWKEKANRDALTGLYNKEHFEQFTSNILQSGTLVSAGVVFVDIDDFKKVNDTLGHVVGDDVICCVAKRIFGVFRHTDVVSRYGGDEFVVFVNGITRPDLEKRLQQLCDGFRFPYRNGDVEYPVSCSIGGAMFPQAGTQYLDLLDRADCALYTAKHRGKNQFVIYEPGMEENVPQDKLLK